MVTTLKVYDGQSITFYSADMQKTAALYLDNSDNLVIDSSSGGIYPSGTDAGRGTLKINLLDVGLSGSPGNINNAVWNGSVIDATKGGTGQSSFSTGDLLYASSGTGLSKLTAGTVGQVLTISGGLPTWSHTFGTSGVTTTVGGNLTISGNLTVSGTTTTVNTATLNIADNIMTLNSDVTGTPSENAGIEVERGTSTNSSIIWDETADAWYADKVGAAGTLEQIVTLTSSQNLTNKTFSSNASTGLSLTPQATGFTIAGGTTSKTVTHSATQTFTGTDNTILSLAGNLTTSGAYGITLTATGTTSITLPTAGTVATVAGAETFTNKTGFNGLIITANTGVVTTGTWNATAIITAYGGTGLTSYTAGDMLYYTSGTALTKLAKGAANSVLQMNSGATAPEWRANLNLGTGTITSGDITSSGSLIVATTAGQNNFVSGFTGSGWRFTSTAYSSSTAKNITAAVAGTGVVTVTALAHGLVVGQNIVIASVVGMTHINGEFKVLSTPSADTFTIGVQTSQTYTSGGTVTGRAMQSTGEVDNLVVRGSMRIYELLVQQIRATNGSVFVTSTGKIASASLTTGTIGAASSTYTLTTENGTNHGFAANDLIRAQKWSGGGTVYQVDLQVTSVTSTTVFVATLLSTNAYIQTTGVSAFTGLDFVRLGNSSDTSRQGAVYLTADDSSAPYIDIIDGVAAHSEFNSTAKVKVRLGKLSGIIDTAVGLNSSAVYGLYSDSAFLKGNLVVGGVTQGIALTNNTVAIGNVAGTANSAIKIANTGTNSTSGVFGYSSGGAEQFALRLDGTAQIGGWTFTASGVGIGTLSSGGITLAAHSTAGSNKIYVGTGTYNNANTAFYVDGSGNFSLKDKLTWDGSTLSITGSITSTIGNIGGWAINPGSLSSTNVTLTSGASASIALGSATAFGSGNGVWIDNNTAGSFRVGNPSGNRISYASDGTVTLVATNAQITGTTGWLSGSTIFSWDATAVTIGAWKVAASRIYTEATNSRSAIQISDGVWSTAANRRVELGNLDATDGKFGIRLYNSSGTEIMEVSDTEAHIASWYFSDTSLWSGNAAIGNGATNIVLTQSATAANAKIALGGGATSANSITIAGTETGILFTGDGNFKIYGDADNYLRKNGTTLELVSQSFVLKGSTTLYIDTSKIALGTSASTIDLSTTGTGVFMNTSGHFRAGSTSAYIKWDGTNFTWAGANNSLSATTLTTTNAVIGGWTINSTSISSTGGISLTHSGTAANNSIGIGTGGYGNASQSFWVDGSGRMSLKDK